MLDPKTYANLLALGLTEEEIAEFEEDALMAREREAMESDDDFIPLSPWEEQAELERVLAAAADALSSLEFLPECLEHFSALEASEESAASSRRQTYMAPPSNN